VNTKIKILYLITLPEAGGAQAYVLDLATHLKDDFAITVASGGLNTDWLPIKLKDAGIPWYGLKYVKRSILPHKDLAAIFEIRRLIKKINPDVIHLNSSKISILGSLAAWGLNKKVIYTAHGWVFLEPLPEILKKFYLWAEKLSANYKNKVICVSEYDRSAARKNLFPMDKIITIQNGIDTKHTSTLNNQEAREKLSSISANLNLATAKTIIGCIANLYPTKNLPALIKAAKQLSQTSPDTIFTIIGEGPEKKHLQDIIKQKKLTDKVFLLGSIQNAKKYLPAFNVFVLPSVKEGLPYTLLEAMAMGLPIVATRVGGIFEILEFYPQTHYRLVEPNDITDLTTALQELQNQSPLNLQQLQRVHEQIDIGNMINKTKEIYLN
jgi:glycosyltransferase involved in cell wall biosynthesis